MCIGCEVIAEGCNARLNGESMAAGPYPVMSPLGYLWVQGWLEEDGDQIEVVVALEMQTRRERA